MAKFKYYKPPKSKRVAYCHFHRWVLSAKQVKKKSCLNKKNIGANCRHLEKIFTHPYWRQRGDISQEEWEAINK